MNTKAMISCVVNGLTRQLEDVMWVQPDGGGLITDGEDGYMIDVGTYRDDSNKQITVLTIPADMNEADYIYFCAIQSDEHGKTADSPAKANVRSDVFSK